MRNVKDIYAAGNDYCQSNGDYFDPKTYQNGYFLKITGNLNKRILNLPQDEWIHTDDGYYLSPDYAHIKCGESFKFRWGLDAEELRNATGGWLASVEYTGYDYEFAYKYLRDMYWEVGGCSSVHKGGLRGRNYDWFYDDHHTFLVRTAAVNGRHATIGLAASQGEYEENPKDMRGFKILPFRLLDGINDAGLVINTNVCQILDDDGNLDIAEVTDKLEPAIPMLMFVRYMLDYCADVDEVIDVVNTRNFYAANKEDTMVENFHFMVSDKTGKTVVIEFDNNTPVITEANIMTNVKLCGMTGHDYGAGYERMEIAESMYDSITDTESMLNVMKSIWYTNAYKSFKEHRDIQWYSECNGKGVWDGKLIDLHQGMPKEAYQKMIDKMVEMYDRRSRETGDTWQTVHTSIYDTDNNKLTIVVQEDDEYRVDLDIKF